MQLPSEVRRPSLRTPRCRVLSRPAFCPASYQVHRRSLLIADRPCSRHANAMGRNPTERTPNLFSAAAVGDTSAPPKLPGTEAATEIASQRHVLPKNLRNAVKHLSDGELNLMYAATLEEMKRRGRIPQGLEAVSHAGPDSTKPESAPTEKRHANAAEAPLTPGQLNLVRAAFTWCRALADCSIVRNMPIECAEGFVAG